MSVKFDSINNHLAQSELQLKEVKTILNGALDASPKYSKFSKERYENISNQLNTVTGKVSFLQSDVSYLTMAFAGGAANWVANDLANSFLQKWPHEASEIEDLIESLCQKVGIFKTDMKADSELYKDTCHCTIQ